MLVPERLNIAPEKRFRNTNASPVRFLRNALGGANLCLLIKDCADRCGVFAVEMGRRLLSLIFLKY